MCFRQVFLNVYYDLSRWNRQGVAVRCIEKRYGPGYHHEASRWLWLFETVLARAGHGTNYNEDAISDPLLRLHTAARYVEAAIVIPELLSNQDCPLRAPGWCLFGLL